MKASAFLFTTLAACALTSRTNAESVCASVIAGVSVATAEESLENASPTSKQKKDAFLLIYHAATEGLTFKELQGLMHEPFDFKNFEDATQLAIAHEKLMQLKKILPSFSAKQQNDLMNAIQRFLAEKISRAQKSRTKWNEKHKKEKKANLVRILEGHTDSVTSVVFSPDGKTLASGSHDSTFRLWDMNDLSSDPVIFKGKTLWIDSVTFSPDGKRLVSSDGDNTIYLWNITRPELPPIALASTTTNPTYTKLYINSISISPDGKTLASGSANGSIHFWDINQPTSQPVKFTSNWGYVSSVVYSPDGKLLASGHVDGTIHLLPVIFRPYATTITLRGHTGHVNSVVFSPDGTRLASADSGGIIRVWNLTKRKPTSIVLRGSKGIARTISISPDGKFLASGGDTGTVQIWNLTQPNSTPTTFEGHSQTVLSIAFSSDGTTLASGSQDGPVRLWNWRKVLGLDPLEEDAP